MARKLVVEIIGDASSLNRSLKEATVASNRFGKEVSHSLRGVASGTGIMHGFGRSLAFASGGFLAFEGVSSLLRESVKAAVDAGVAQRSLTAQMRTSGESFKASREQIEQANLGLARFGFTSEDAVHALTVLERGTGNIQEALKLETVSADLARAKNIDLASAATVVSKVFGGQETALRRAVPGLDKQAHGLELIRLAQQRLAGQAAAGTTAGERFAATLHDTEVIIGTALLPTLNHYLTSLTEWLDRMNQSGQLQKDVNQAVGAAKDILDLASGAMKTLNSISGSTKESLKLLFDVFVAFKTLKLVDWLAGVSGGLRRVGTEAETSTGKVKGLRGAFGSLPEVVAITLGIDVVMNAHTTAHGVHRYSGSAGWANLWHDLGHPVRLIQNLSGGGGGGPATSGGNLFSPGFKLPNITANVPVEVPHDLPTVQAALPVVGRAGLSPMQRAALALSAAGRTQSTKDDLAALVTQRQLLAKAIQTETARLNQATSADAAKKFADNLQKLQDKDAAAFNQIASIAKQGQQQAGRTAAELAGQRNTWFDTAIGRMLDRVQDIPQLQGQIAKLRTIAGLIQQQIAAARDVTRKQTLGDQLAQVYRTIKSDQDQQTQNAADAAKAAADRAAAAQQALIAQLQFNVDRTQLTKGTQDDLAALKAQEAGIRKIIATEGSTLDLRNQLLTVELAINAKNQEIADARKAGRDAIKQAAADAEQSKLDWAQLAIDRAGLTDTLTDDLKANQRRLAIINQQISVHGKTLALEQQKVSALRAIKDVRSQQADQAAQAAKAGKDATDKALADTEQANRNTRKLFRVLNATAFVNQFGADLSRSQKRRLEIGLAMTGPGGSIPRGAGTGGQFTAGITIHGGVHMHGVQDVPGMENQIAKRAKARPHVRRGARG